MRILSPRTAPGNTPPRATCGGDLTLLPPVAVTARDARLARLEEYNRRLAASPDDHDGSLGGGVAHDR